MNVQLAHIMRRDHEHPLAVACPQTAAHEAPAPSHLLDMAEWRFHDHTALGVQLPTRIASQALLHALARRRSGAQRPLRGVPLPVGSALFVAVARCNEKVVALRVLARRVLFAPIAGIQKHRSQGLARTEHREVALHQVEHRLELLHVVGLLRDLGRNDDLIRTHDRLRVVPLQIPSAVLHDPTLGIGEVHLRILGSRQGFGLATALLVARRLLFALALKRARGKLHQPRVLLSFEFLLGPPAAS
jgi:hypothetical protein